MEQKTDAQTLFTVTVFTENHVGLLSQISNSFTRRKLNIETLCVSPSSIKGIHKFTITVYSDESTMEKLVKQIEKKVDVIKAFYYTDDDLVYQEVALYKVPTVELIKEPNLESLIRRYNVHILEFTKDYTILEATGHSDEVVSLFKELERYGITQYVSSGRIAVTKSTRELVTKFLAEREKEESHVESPFEKDDCLE